MKIENKLEKKIRTLIQITGEYPKEIEITKEEYEELHTKDKKFRNVILKIK